MNDISLFEIEKENLKRLKELLVLELDITIHDIDEVTKEKSDELGKQLFEMISKRGYDDNNFEKVLELINQGANIEYKNEKKGDFALLVCARKGYFKTFVTLIKAGANINQTNNYLTTATMASARHGYQKILDILIMMGADINAQCLDGDTALMSAKRHSQIECFQTLVDAGAYLNITNQANQTFLDLPGNVLFKASALEENTSTQISKQEEQNPIELLEEAEQKLKILIK